jgi:hypothetical protein
MLVCLATEKVDSTASLDRNSAGHLGRTQQQCQQDKQGGCHADGREILQASKGTGEVDIETDKHACKEAGRASPGQEITLVVLLHYTASSCLAKLPHACLGSCEQSPSPCYTGHVRPMSTVPASQSTV